jgi:predicted transglutaminase-like cysteine proteinase
MCADKPQLCKADNSTTAEASPIKYTKQLKAQLSALNRKWNTRIIPITDQDKHKKREVWEGATDSGDCEEYAIAKKMELLSRGTPQASFSTR